MGIAAASTRMLRRSSAVRNTKRLLFGLAGMLFLMLAVYAWVGDDQSGVRLVLSPKNTAEADALPEMIHPVLQSSDAKNRPYTITADKATQLDENRVLLHNIQADMMLEGEEWLSLLAGQGMLYPGQSLLELSGEAQMFYEGGYEMRSESAVIYIKDSRVETLAPVSGQGPVGQIKANRFEALEKGKRLVFKDSVRVILYP